MTRKKPNFEPKGWRPPDWLMVLMIFAYILLIGVFVAPFVPLGY